MNSQYDVIDCLDMLARLILAEGEDPQLNEVAEVYADLVQRNDGEALSLERYMEDVPDGFSIVDIEDTGESFDDELNFRDINLSNEFSEYKPSGFKDAGYINQHAKFILEYKITPEEEAGRFCRNGWWDYKGLS